MSLGPLSHLDCPASLVQARANWELFVSTFEAIFNRRAIIFLWTMTLLDGMRHIYVVKR